MIVSATGARLVLRPVLTALAFVATGATAPADPALPVYGYVFTPPAMAVQTPRILKVELNSDHLNAHGPIAIRVSTTPDVTTVVSGHGRMSGKLTRVAPGVFTSESTLPRVHLIFGAAHINIHFEAKTASGGVATADVPVSYH
jgi:hypothetical protein